MDPLTDSAASPGSWQRGLACAANAQWREAADCFLSVAAGDPGHVAALLNAADALLQLDRYRQARRCALQAGDRLDGYPHLLIEVCQRLRRFNETSRLLALVAGADLRAYGASPRLTELASLVSASGDQGQARALIEGAVLADPGNAHAQYMRGVIAMFQGDMDDARWSLEACLAIAPAFAQAHWVLSGFGHPAAGSDAVLERLRARAAEATPWSNAEAYLSFALHNEFHARGRYDEAWRALERACAVKRKLVPYEPRRVADLFSRVKSMCTPAFLEPAQGGDDGCIPIFIIGMHRSGTTLMERILGGHSLVADGGETYTFTAQLDIAADHKTVGALDSTTVEKLAGADFSAIGSGFLEASRRRAQGKPFMTEKLPPNLVNAGFIAKALPNAKILHMVRNPVDTCFSNLRTYFTQTAPYSYDQHQLADYHAQYLDLMRHWHAAMPGRILDVAYDGLVSDTEETARRVFAFCGLPFEPGTLSVDRRDGAVSTASTAYVRQGILPNRGEAWKPYEAYLQPLLGRLAEQAAR